MIRLIHALMRIVVAVIVCGGALTLIYMSMVTEPEWQDTVRTISKFQIEAVLLGFGAFTIGVVYMMSGSPPTRPDQVLTFPGGSGSMSIGLRELAEFLAPLADDFESVESLRPRVVVEKNGVHVILDVKINEGPHVRDDCDMLQQQTRRRLAAGLGIRDISNVTVHVVEFCNKGQSNWGGEGTAVEEPEPAPEATVATEVVEPAETEDQKNG